MLKETKYNILIVSSSDKFAQSISKFLTSYFHSSCDVAPSLNQANRLLLERNYHILIVSSPGGDQNIIDFALNANDSYNIGILLLVSAYEYPEVFDKTNEYGILTLAKPIENNIFLQSLSLLVATIEKMNTIKIKSKSELSFKEKMGEIKLANEAKLLLIKHKKFTETEAHKYIEKRAMDRRVPKIYIIKEIILQYR
ncbi:MAG: ANTAR domain-containing response regulator [Bacilli bacterium]